MSPKDPYLESAASADRTFRWIDPDQSDADAVLRRLLHEAAEVVPGLSSDPALTDPLVRLLLAAVSREYARLYGQLDEVIDVAYRRLVESLLSFPRAPRPASTVLHLAVSDPGTRIDENLRVVGRKAVAGGKGRPEETNIHFSPWGQQIVPGVPSPAVIFVETSGQARLLAQGGGLPGAAAVAGGSWQTDPVEHPAFLLGFDLPAGLDVEEIEVFVAGGEESASAVMWASWESGVASGRRDFVPGRLQSLHPWHRAPEPALFRSRTDQSAPASDYDRFFVPLSVAGFLLPGQGATPHAVEAGVSGGHLPSVPSRCWVQVHLAAGVTASQVAKVRFVTNCVVAFNINRESASFSVGTEPIVVVRMPVRFSELFRIFEVHDSANHATYTDAESPEALGASHRYHLDTSGEGSALLRLAAKQPSLRPRKIEVQYATTYGKDADALDPGSIAVIYDHRLTPGVEKAVNVVPSAGGGEPGRETQHAEELRAVLASRGRALTRHDYAQLARAFDPERIVAVEVERGVLGTDRGVSTCVQVRVKIRGAKFVSDLERESFRAALNDYLQTRASAGQSVVVRLEV